MLRNFYFFLRCRFYAIVCTLRRYYAVNKLHFIVSLACAACGLLIALSGVYKDEPQSANIIVIFTGGQRSPLSTIIHILFYTSLAYIAIFVAAIHFWLFILSYGGIIAGTYYLLRCGLVAVSVDGFLGLLFLVLYIMPIFIFNLFAIIVLLNKVYDQCGYITNKRYFNNSACFSRGLAGEIVRFYGAALLWTYCVWLVIYLLLLIIC